MHCIDNPELLGLIATAYHEVRSTIYLERLFMEAVHFPGGKYDHGAEKFYLRGLTAKDNDLLASIEAAVKAICTELESLSDTT